MLLDITVHQIAVRLNDLMRRCKLTDALSSMGCLSCKWIHQVLQKREHCNTFYNGSAAQDRLVALLMAQNLQTRNNKGSARRPWTTAVVIDH